MVVLCLCCVELMHSSICMMGAELFRCISLQVEKKKEKETPVLSTLVDIKRRDTYSISAAF